MKLIPEKQKPKIDNSVRGRLIQDVQTQLYRLTVLLDGLKKDGTDSELIAAEKILWGAIRMLDANK